MPVEPEKEVVNVAVVNVPTGHQPTDTYHHDIESPAPSAPTTLSFGSPDPIYKPQSSVEDAVPAAPTMMSTVTASQLGSRQKASPKTRERTPTPEPAYRAPTVWDTPADTYSSGFGTMDASSYTSTMSILPKADDVQPSYTYEAGDVDTNLFM
jgi:hypothetical protein